MADPKVSDWFSRVQKVPCRLVTTVSKSAASPVRRSPAFARAIFPAHPEAYARALPGEISRHPPHRPGPDGGRKIRCPRGYSDHYHHIKNWIEAIRSRQPVVEDPVYGFRAAGAALLSNLSFETGQPARWDPEAMKLL